MEKQTERAVSQAIALEATGEPTDYHWRKPVDITTGLWALLWSLLLPVVGVIIGIIAISKGRSSRRKSVTNLGIFAIILSIASTGIYAFGLSEVSEQPTISAFSLKTSKQKYTDTSGYSYFTPSGMKPTDDDYGQAEFRLKVDDMSGASLSPEVFMTKSDAIYPEELDRALEAMKNQESNEYYLWWKRVLSEKPNSDFKLISSKLKNNVTYLDIELQSPESLFAQDQQTVAEHDRVAVALQVVDDSVFIQILKYNSYFGADVITPDTSAWQKITQNVTYNPEEEES